MLEDNKYSAEYSETKFWEKAKSSCKNAGLQVIYAALLLYYAMQKPGVPAKHKALIIGALGYFILPLDLIPDFILIAGFTDDLAALVFALANVAMYIDDPVKNQARQKIRDWFGEVDNRSFNELENQFL